MTTREEYDAFVRYRAPYTETTTMLVMSSWKYEGKYIIGRFIEQWKGNNFRKNYHTPKEHTRINTGAEILPRSRECTRENE